MARVSDTRIIYGRNEDGTLYFSMGSWVSDSREATRFHKNEVGKIVDYLIEQQKSAREHRVYNIRERRIWDLAVYSADEVLEILNEKIPGYTEDDLQANES